VEEDRWKFIMIENYCHHSSDLREIPGLIDEQKYAQAYMGEYVNDNSFLFQVIEPIDIDVISKFEESSNN
jgi:hypothetical protein